MTISNPQQTVPWSARLVALASIGGAILTLAYPSATRQFTWPWVIVYFLVWLLPLISALVTFTRADSWRRPNLMLGAGLFSLAVSTVLSAWLSPFPNVSELRIWPTLSGVALFFWLFDWLNNSGAPAKSSRGPWAVKLVTVLGAITAVISLISWRWRAAGVTGILRNDFPFGHSTYTAGFLILLLPWLIYAIATAQSGVIRVAWSLALIAGFWALVVTSSRGAIIALVLIGALACAYIIVRSSWAKNLKWTVVILTAVVLLVAVFTNPRLRELAQQGSWGNSSRASNDQRNAMIEAGWRLGLARPWIGWGPGTIPLAYPRTRGQLPSGGVDNVLQLHDTPIQVWATLGIGGMFALLLLSTAAVRRFRQVVSEAEPIALTAAAGIAGYGLFSLTDHQLDLPAMNLLLVFNLALFFRDDPQSGKLSFKPVSRSLFSAGVAAVLFGPLMSVRRDLTARFEYDQALSSLEAAQPEKAKEHLEIAARRAPYDPYYRQQIAGILLDERLHTGDPATQQRLAREAAAQLEKSLAAGCFQEFANLNLGWLAIEDSKPRVAARYFLSAAREAPHRSGVYFGLGLALRELGDEPGAIRAFALEWINDPINYTAPVWEFADFSPLRPAIEREATALLDELTPSHPLAPYIQQLWAWWSDGKAIPSARFTEESTAFCDNLIALASHQPARLRTETYAWGRLFIHWQSTAGASEFISAGEPDPAFAAALARRRSRHSPPDWHGFFTAGVEGETSLLESFRSQRSGYGVLASHPDGPILTDLYVRQENRFIVSFASGIFPPKGWLVAQDLIRRFPSVPTASP